MNSTFVPSQLAVGDWLNLYGPADSALASYLAKTAIEHVSFRGEALILGYEALHDSVLALENGFCVAHAVDASFNAGKNAQQVFKKYGGRFKLTQSRFEDFDFGFFRYNLVLSDKALPYHGENGFEYLFERAKVSLRPDGVIAVSLFGIRDQWLENHQGLAIHTKQEIKSLLSDFEIMSINEVEYDGHFIDGTPKHWHYFRVYARKPQGY